MSESRVKFKHVFFLVIHFVLLPRPRLHLLKPFVRNFLAKKAQCECSSVILISNDLLFQSHDFACLKQEVACSELKQSSKVNLVKQGRSDTEQLPLRC